MHTFWFIYIFSQTPSAGALSTQSPPPVIWGCWFFFLYLTFSNICFVYFSKQMYSAFHENIFIHQKPFDCRVRYILIFEFDTKGKL